jgi:DNA polymerase-3 subunit gamma/tau
VAAPPVRGVAAAIADAATAPAGAPTYSDLDAPEPDEPEPDWTREPEPDTGAPPVVAAGAPSSSPASTPSAAPARSARSGGSGGSGGARGARQPSGERQRYGEAVVREILGANFIEERPATRPNRPSIRPTGEGA